jgi:manganese oxidase
MKPHTCRSFGGPLWVLSCLFACFASVAPQVVAAETNANAATTVFADVVALDQPFMFNRLGAAQPQGMIFALARDIVPMEAGQGVTPGNVMLRKDKRARPIVLRVNAGQFLEIHFTNLLSPQPVNPPTAAPITSLQPVTRSAGVHVTGMELVSVTLPDGTVQPGIASDATWVGVNPSSLAAPGQQRIYKYYAKEEGTFMLYSAGGDWAGQLQAGLFGAATVEPAHAQWYRSQVTREDLELAAYRVEPTPGGCRVPGREDLSFCRKAGPDGKPLTVATEDGELALWSFHAPGADESGAQKTDVVIRNDRVFTPDGRPLVDYNAVYPAGHPRAGQPILLMTRRLADGRDELVSSDLTAIIAGPDGGGFPFSENGPGFAQNPTYPNRRAPFREFTIMYHETFGTVQAFQQFYAPQLADVMGAGTDNFAINYGSAGIGAEVLASRLGVGPMGGKESVDLKFEEFFLSSWACGDPAMVVDVPANAPNQTVTDPTLGSRQINSAITNGTATAFSALAGKKATKAYFPDDPSNVYHSYIRDRVTMRILHTGGGITHVHHLHAHQWLRSPNSDDGHYLDSQMITPGSTYTMEIAHNGSGNLNETVGDSIFHCHFYPHFAGGMWALWRTHDVFEAGTRLDREGRPAPGWNRALPDAEIATGTPIPAIVPLPTLAMAPAPAPVRLIDNGHRVEVRPKSSDRRHEIVYDSPGFPFFVPGVSGHRAPHPPLDMAWEESAPGVPVRDKDGKMVYLDGGLPRHQVLDGTIVHELHTRWDFSKDFLARDKDGKPVAGGLVAFELPEEGTEVEKAAMAAHSTRTRASFLPNGDPGNYTLNGLPPAHGAPFANPSVDENGNAKLDVRRYQGAAIQTDAVLNKQGWHFPQQRMITLWQDVKPTISGERAPQPFFFRANTGETIEFWHTNLVPDYYDLDDFQVRTPTDIIGQHIHLVKFDVLASDGAGNGWNYEDGTFSPDEVRTRIDAINLSGGIHAFDSRTQFAAKKQRKLEIKPAPAVFGPAPAGQDWAGAQTTIQRWDTDPVVNNKGEDRTLRTVFTHDHFGPSTHQQAGLYGGLLVEPQGSKWYDPISGGLLYDKQQRHDGGPTSWQANIVTANPADSYREFAIEFGDFQLAYGPGSPSQPGKPANALFTAAFPALQSGAVPADVASIFASNGVVFANDQTKLEKSKTPGEWLLTYRPAKKVEEHYRLAPPPATTPPLATTPTTPTTYAVYPLELPHSWAAPIYVINPAPVDANNQVSGAPYPTLISVVPSPGTFALNYRNEPIPSRVWNPTTQQPAAGTAGDLSFAYASITRADARLNQQPVPGTAINPADPTGFKFPANINPTINGLATTASDPGKVQPTDPFTPMFRAYAGDKVQVRTLVGSQHNPHYFSIDGVSWLYEPGYDESGYRNNQPMGISEHYEMNFLLPRATAATTQPFADHRYEASAGVDGITNGMWGILRSYQQPVTGLVPLPNNVPPAKPAVAAITPPAGAKVRSIHVVATSVTQATGGGLVYNSRGQTTALNPPAFDTALPVTDPDALIYVRAEDLDASGKLIRPGRIEPLILRAAAGEWIELTLTNNFQPAQEPAIFANPVAAASPYGESNFFTIPAQPGNTFAITHAVVAQFQAAGYGLALNATVASTLPNFVGWTLTPPTGATGSADMDYTLTQAGDKIYVSPTINLRTSPNVGLNPQVVGYDITRANGVNVGFNPTVTVAPGQTGAPVYWYAGALAVGPDGVLATTPVEFGAINLTPSDPLQQHTLGLVGALVIEPEGSTWTEDVNQRASATVTKADGSLFRDFVMLCQDDVTLTNAGGAHTVNYGTEPFAYRYPTAYFPGGNFPAGDGTQATSNTLVAADPQTPIYVAGAGMPARFRMLHPASAAGADGEVLTIDGHVFQEEPFTDDSRVIGDNPRSQWFGARGGHGARDRFDVVLPSAGGEHRVPGDYLYRSLIALLGGGDIAAGEWGIFRVTAPGKDAVLIQQAAANGSLTVSGANSVNPATGVFAKSVQVFGGGSVSGTPLATADVDPLTGAWSVSQALTGAAPSEISVLSSDGGVAKFALKSQGGLLKAAVSAATEPAHKPSPVLKRYEKRRDQPSRPPEGVKVIRKK